MGWRKALPLHTDSPSTVLYIKAVNPKVEHTSRFLGISWPKSQSWFSSSSLEEVFRRTQKASPLCVQGAPPPKFRNSCFHQTRKLDLEPPDTLQFTWSPTAGILFSTFSTGSTSWTPKFGGVLFLCVSFISLLFLKCCWFHFMLLLHYLPLFLGGFKGKAHL